MANTFERMVPSTPDKLHENLKMVHENRKYIKTVSVNKKEKRIEVDLNFMGEMKQKDFCIPLKEDKLDAAQKLVEKLWNEKKAPTAEQAKELFGYIDQGERGVAPQPKEALKKAMAAHA